MIKQLITDLAYDNIKLSQALTRGKIIENRIKNDTFKKWLNKELEGYEFADKYLPSYRKIHSQITLLAEFPYGQTQSIPLIVDESMSPTTRDLFKFHRVIEPISIVEEQISIFEGASGSITLPPDMVGMLSKLYTTSLDEYDAVIRRGSRSVGKVQYQNVLEQTKQKLLDTLMELEDVFPNLLNEHSLSKADSDKVQNIITTNIYGSGNPLNIAAGSNVEQTINNTYISKENEELLKSLGVEDVEINELKEIVSTHKSDIPTLKDRSMKWLGSVLASVAGRGLYDNIPAITEFVNKLIP